MDAVMMIDGDQQVKEKDRKRWPHEEEEEVGKDQQTVEVARSGQLPFSAEEW